MRLYAGSGQQAAALRQYEICERVLMEELGVSPAPETTELWQAIRERRLPQLQIGPERPPEVPPTPRHNLPTSLTPFVGRRALLAEIRERLQDPGCRLLSLVGPGGSGKTRLALEAAAREIPRFRDGVFFVSLAPLQSVDAIVPTVAQALSFPLSTRADRDPRQQLLDYLRGKQMLLMLDNFEHLLEGVGVAVEVLRAAPEVKIMSTSRARLNVQGEHLLPVPGMDVPSQEAEAPLSQYDAVELFLRSARRVRPDFDPTVEELGQVGSICRMVGGMPLAILLAASWMTMLDPGEIMGEMSLEGLDFLETDWRDVPERQRSMRAVLDHSWGLLSEGEQGVLAGLSAFRGGFRQRAARQVTGTSIQELRTLVNRSLVQRTPSGRYEMHELLRRYGAERLALSSAAEASLHDRHCAYYAAALQRWEAELRGPRQAEAIAEIEPEVENARAAWDWAVERGDVVRIGQAMDGLCRFYERRGRLQEGEAACRQAAERLGGMEKELLGEGLRVLIRAWGWQGRLNQLMGRTEVARQSLGQGMRLLDEPTMAGIDTRPERAFLLQQLGRIAYWSDREEAQRLWEESLALCRALDDRWGTASLLSHLGELVSNVSDAVEATRMLRESLALRRRLGDQRGIADALEHLQGIAIFEGRLEESQSLLNEAMEIRANIGDRVGVLRGYLRIGLHYLFDGQFADAHRSLESMAGPLSDLGMRQPLGDANWGLALTKIHLGLYDEARRICRETLVLFRSLSDLRGVARCLDGLGRIALAREAPTRAARLLGEGARLFQRIGQRHEAAHTLTSLGHAQRKLGRSSQAKQTLWEALGAAAEIGHFHSQIDSLLLVAMLLADQGEGKRAIEIYALAMRYPNVGNSRYWEDVAGKHITALASMLPPEVVAAAQERGQARDLQATIMELLKGLDASDGG